jgi:hypothetical protein
MTDLYGIAGGSLVVLAVIVGVPYLVRRWRRISAKVDAQMAAEQKAAAELDEALMWGEFERQFGPAKRRFICKEPGCDYQTPLTNTVTGALLDCREHPHASWLFTNRPTQEQP